MTSTNRRRYLPPSVDDWLDPTIPSRDFTTQLASATSSIYLPYLPIKGIFFLHATVDNRDCSEHLEGRHPFYGCSLTRRIALEACPYANNSRGRIPTYINGVEYRVYFTTTSFRGLQPRTTNTSVRPADWARKVSGSVFNAVDTLGSDISYAFDYLFDWRTVTSIFATREIERLSAAAERTRKQADNLDASVQLIISAAALHREHTGS